jgi:hypothetical protein
VCETCGKSFKTKRHIAALYDHHYCSKTCQIQSLQGLTSKCEVCGHFTPPDNDGNYICHLCKVDRDAMQAEGREQ